MSDERRPDGTSGTVQEPGTDEPAPAAGEPAAMASIRRRPPKRRRGGCATATLMLLVLAGAVALGVWWLLFKPVAYEAAGMPAQVEVRAGDSTMLIGEKLAEKGIVANPLMFRVVLRLSTSSEPVRAGVYDMSTGMGYEAVLALLRQGPPVRYVTLTVPEGWTIDQIARRLQAVSGISATDFAGLAKTGARQFDHPFLKGLKTDSLEGYLFPKTYRVRAGSTARDVIEMMLRQFGQETAGLDLSYPSSRGMGLRDVVVIASMIERETRTARDRPLVSSVIYNRLARHMRLQIDATVQYLVGNKPRLLYRDLRADSPYNTYLHRGLPIGPIANPGMASLKAASLPRKTRYLYYVLTHKDGSHSFAVTSAEFARLKAQAGGGLK